MDNKPETADEALLAQTLGNVYLLRKETQALLGSVQHERELMRKELEAESKAFKTAFSELQSLISSQRDEMEITVTAGVRKINDATTENAKTIALQIENQVRTQTSTYGNNARKFFDTNTEQSLEAINDANKKALDSIEKRRNQLVGSINAEFLGKKARGWFLVWSVAAIILLGAGVYVSHGWLKKELRDDIWQASSQFSKIKH